MDDYKIEPFSIIRPKASPYMKSYGGRTKQMYFLIESDDLLKNIMIFGIKLAIVLKRNLIANPPIIKNF